eukprot:jgi/Mesen1/10502/ME000083S10010
MEPVVLDHGSGFIRAGYANADNDPSLVFPSAFARVTGNEGGTGISSELDINEGTQLPDLNTIVHPIERGIIENWEVMESIWRYIFYSQMGWELGNEGQVLVAEPLCASKVGLFSSDGADGWVRGQACREQLTQVMFEEFNVMGLYAVEQAILNLYAIGRLTGCSVDIGHGKLEIAPIVEGAVQHAAVKRLKLAGQDLDALLMRQLAESQPHVKLTPELVTHLKEELCHTAESAEAYAAALKHGKTVEHTLPDGQVIEVGHEMYTAGEALFQPAELMGVDEHSLAEQVVQQVSLSGPIETQKQVLDGIVLAGGTSLMRGFDTRFVSEATSASSPSLKPNLLKPPDYMPENTLKHCAWMGGAILAKVVFPQNQFITKGDYDETGPTIVHKKC